MSSSLSLDKKSETSDEVEVVEQETSESKKVVVPTGQALRTPRPVSLKYLTAQEFLLRKGVKATHISVYVAKAMSLGYTRATASEWDSLLFGKS